MSEDERKTLTVRIPPDLYAAGVALAHTRKMSLNALILEGMAAVIKAEEYHRLYSIFGDLSDMGELVEDGILLNAQVGISEPGGI